MSLLNVVMLVVTGGISLALGMWLARTSEKRRKEDTLRQQSQNHARRLQEERDAWQAERNALQRQLASRQEQLTSKQEHLDAKEVEFEVERRRLESLHAQAEAQKAQLETHQAQALDTQNRTAQALSAAKQEAEDLKQELVKIEAQHSALETQASEQWVTELDRWRSIASEAKLVEMLDPIYRDRIAPRTLQAIHDRVDGMTRIDEVVLFSKDGLPLTGAKATSTLADLGALLSQWANWVSNYGFPVWNVSTASRAAHRIEILHMDTRHDLWMGWSTYAKDVPRLVVDSTRAFASVLGLTSTMPLPESELLTGENVYFTNGSERSDITSLQPLLQGFTATAVLSPDRLVWGTGRKGSVVFLSQLTSLIQKFSLVQQKFQDDPLQTIRLRGPQDTLVLKRLRSEENQWLTALRPGPIDDLELDRIDRRIAHYTPSSAASQMGAAS